MSNVMGIYVKFHRDHSQNMVMSRDPSTNFQNFIFRLILYQILGKFVNPGSSKPTNQISQISQNLSANEATGQQLTAECKQMKKSVGSRNAYIADTTLWF